MSRRENTHCRLFALLFGQVLQGSVAHWVGKGKGVMDITLGEKNNHTTLWRKD